MSTKTLMTVEQFARLRTADTEDYELVEGELIPLSSGTDRHNRIRDMIGHLLWVYFRENPIGDAVGENDFRVKDGTVRRPDLSIFLDERLKQIDLDRVPAAVAPDIAVEILSRSEGIIDLHRKVREYFRAGAKEVWLLDHANAEAEIRTTEGIRLLQESDVLESPLLPGFSAKISDLFT
jgi:Uma2 family endonuclease